MEKRDVVINLLRIQNEIHEMKRTTKEEREVTNEKIFRLLQLFDQVKLLEYGCNDGQIMKIIGITKEAIIDTINYFMNKKK